jgi:hypothetical protein
VIRKARSQQDQIAKRALMPSTLRVLAVFAALAAACAAAGRLDVAAMGGGFKGDEATYVGLAASLGFDGDLTYGPQDY